MTSPETPPIPDPLRPLIERARAPEGEQEDIDALLAECDRPLEPGEDRDERARLLRSIVEDAFQPCCAASRRKPVEST